MRSPVPPKKKYFHLENKMSLFRKWNVSIQKIQWLRPENEIFPHPHPISSGNDLLFVIFRLRFRILRRGFRDHCSTWSGRRSRNGKTSGGEFRRSVILVLLWNPFHFVQFYLQIDKSLHTVLRQNISLTRDEKKIVSISITIVILPPEQIRIDERERARAQKWYLENFIVSENFCGKTPQKSDQNWG